MLRRTSAIVVAACLTACGAFLGLEGDDDEAAPPASDASADGARDAGGESSVDDDSGGAADATKDARPDADAGTTNPLACNGKQACERFVFVTSAPYAGNFDGATADAKCQALADATASLVDLKGRQWRAWISASASAPASTHLGVFGTSRYKRVDGTTIADDFVDLADGAIDAPIDRDETGTLRAGAAVWTATNTNGTYSAPSCNAFTSSSNATTAIVGDTTSATDAWTSAGQLPCAMEARLYCFEY